MELSQYTKWPFAIRYPLHVLNYNSEFPAAMQIVAIYGIDFAPRDQLHIKPIKYSIDLEL